MTLARFAKKRDANEAEIVQALREAGALVHPLDRPVDLLVGFRGAWTLLEVKRPKGAVGEQQAIFMAICEDRKLPAAVVRSPGEALEAIGAVYTIGG